MSVTTHVRLVSRYTGEQGPPPPPPSHCSSSLNDKPPEGSLFLGGNLLPLMSFIYTREEANKERLRDPRNERLGKEARGKLEVSKILSG